MPWGLGPSPEAGYTFLSAPDLLGVGFWMEDEALGARRDLSCASPPHSQLPPPRHPSQRDRGGRDGPAPGHAHGDPAPTQGRRCPEEGGAAQGAEAGRRRQAGVPPGGDRRREGGDGGAGAACAARADREVGGQGERSSGGALCSVLCTSFGRAHPNTGPTSAGPVSALVIHRRALAHPPPPPHRHSIRSW